jgi:hypothetical protein
MYLFTLRTNIKEISPLAIDRRLVIVCIDIICPVFIHLLSAIGVVDTLSKEHKKTLMNDPVRQKSRTKKGAHTSALCSSSLGEVCQQISQISEA